MSRKHWYIAIGASAVLLLLLRKKAAAAAPPAVAGVVTSGGQSLAIDDNVLSPTFGLPIQPN